MGGLRVGRVAGYVVPRVVASLVGSIGAAGVALAGKVQRVAEMPMGHGVHEVKELARRARPYPARHDSVEVCLPRTLECAEYVRVLGVGLHGVRTVVECHRVRTVSACRVSERAVAVDMFRCGGNPVEEHIVDVVPFLVTFELDQGGAEWTATVAVVDVARDCDTGVAETAEHGKKGVVGALAGPAGDVEHDQSHLLSPRGQPLPVGG